MTVPAPHIVKTILLLCGLLVMIATVPRPLAAQDVKKGVVTTMDTTRVERVAKPRNSVLSVNPSVTAARPELDRSIADIDTNLVRRLEVGKTSLDRRDYAGAVDLLQSGLREAEGQEDTSLEAAFSFHLGVAYQKQAADAASPQELLSQAATFYEKQLQIQPSGPALNNLAKVYEKQGDFETAAGHYKEAILLDAERQGLYAVNLAQLYKNNGDLAAAKEYYQVAVEANPDDPRANRGLTSTYLATDVNQLILHLWKMVDRGRELRAIDNALAALLEVRGEATTDFGYGVSQKAMLLGVVVGGLAKAGPAFLNEEDPRSSEQDEARSAFVRAMRRLASDREIGDGVAEIFKLGRRRAELEPGEFSWWAPQGRQYDPEVGIWPRDAFRSLIRSYGQWYYRAGDLETAERYYMLAVRLSEGHDQYPDLEALVRLADIYVETDRIGQINEVIQRYTEQLFHGKGQAYRDSDFKKIYEFHRTLGLLYAYIGNWGSSYQITSAFFQLENAIEKRDIYNERLAETLGENPLPVDVRVVQTLARGYDMEDPDRGAELRLRFVGELIGDGSLRAASNLLEQIDSSALATGLRAEYEERVAQMASLRP